MITSWSFCETRRPIATTRTRSRTPALIASGRADLGLAPGVVDPLQARGEILRQQRLELPVVTPQRREVGVLDGHDPGDEILEVMGHDLGVDRLGPQPTGIAPIDRGRDIHRLQPDPERRLLAAELRIQSPAELRRFPGKPGIELVVQREHRVMPGTQPGQGRDGLPVRPPDELPGRGADLGEELGNRRPEDEGVARERRGVVGGWCPLERPLDGQVDDRHGVRGRGRQHFHPRASAHGPAILNEHSVSTTRPCSRAVLAAGILGSQGAIITPREPKLRRSSRVTAVIPVQGVNSVSQRRR